MITRHSKAYHFAVWILAFSSFLVFYNLYAVQPLLADFALQFKVSTSLANWIFAAASLGLSLCLIPWAIIADRFGRRLVILLSLGLTSVVSMLLAMANGIEGWIILRFLQGLALAGLPAVAVAYITEEFEKNSVANVIGIYIAANSLGGISGRLAGGFLGENLGLNTPLFVCAILTFFGTIATYFYLPSEKNFSSQKLSFNVLRENLCGHIKNPLLWRIFLFSGLCFGVFINLFSVIGLRLMQTPWQLSTTQVSFLFLCYLSGTFAASLTGKLTQRFSVIRGLFLGWLILVVGVLLLLSEQIYLIIIGLLICSIGFFSSHALASGWVGKQAKQARALASALYLSAYYLGASLVGFYLIFLWQSFNWLAVPLGAMLLLSIACWLIYTLYQHNKNKK